MPKATKKAAPKKAATSSDNILGNVNLTSAMSYFPYFIGAVAMYFLAENKKSVMHHVKYSAILAVIVIALMFVLNSFFAGILNLAYWVWSAFLAFKAYKGEAVQVEILDTIEEKISDTIKK